MSSYLETLAKLHTQGLETLKQVQDAQINTLTSIRESVAALPGVPTLPAFEGVPSITELTDLNTSFATKVLEQQNAFVAQLAGIFTPAAK